MESHSYRREDLILVRLTSSPPTPFRRHDCIKNSEIYAVPWHTGDFNTVKKRMMQYYHFMILFLFSRGSTFNIIISVHKFRPIYQK